MTDIILQACNILETSCPLEKAERALKMRAVWQSSPKNFSPSEASAPDKPGRPNRPELVPPSEVPRRRLGSPEGRGALLHAIAHIELNAIDLAADMIARFAQHPHIFPNHYSDFVSDWTKVCAEEAKHFKLLHARLQTLGLAYGDFPAHNGLWDAADSTKHNIAARLAIAPMVLEARGLDVTPNMIEKLTRVNDKESVEILEIIYAEEIDHVKIGAFWFNRIAQITNQDPVTLFHSLVGTHFAGRLKPPFNVQARTLAGLTEEFYRPLANY